MHVGKGRKAITITKFRAMKSGAHLDYGKILRKTNLNELPQIINFLKGELSLVGFRLLTRQDYRLLPEDIRIIYDQVGQDLAGIQYACRNPPEQRRHMTNTGSFTQNGKATWCAHT